MSASILNTGRRKLAESEAIFSNLAEQERQRNRMEDSLKAAQDSQRANQMGTLAGIGVQEAIRGGVFSPKAAGTSAAEIAAGMGAEAAVIDAGAAAGASEAATAAIATETGATAGTSAAGSAGGSAAALGPAGWAALGGLALISIFG